jgi:YVTN family beta-propeller protein
VTGVAVLSVLGTGIAVAVQGGGQAGPHGDGTAITPVGYEVTPVGQQTNLGDLPLAARMSPKGDLMLVSNDGQGTQSLQVVDPHTAKVTQTIPYTSPTSLFVGLAFSPDGGTAYASGGGDEKIHTYRVSGGQLTETASITLPSTSPTGAKINMYPAGLEATPDGKRLVVADHLADAASVVDLPSGAVHTVAVGHAPFGVAVTPDGSTGYVTNQGADTVSVLDLTGPEPTVRATVKVGTHPNSETLDAAAHRLYVANGDSDEISVIDTANNQVVKTISLAPYQGANVGTNPAGLSLSADRKLLYVANTGNNDVDVVDLAGGRVTGHIPTGWYPSAVVALPDRLLVTNAKGLGAGPNNGPGHPDPTSAARTPENQYVGSMIVGTLSTIPLPLKAGQLQQWSQQVAANDGFGRAHAGGRAEPAIKHVIYVVQENRTFDQVFGSLGKGNGDPSLNLFGDESATNQRALQSRFVTLDNFYADAEVSAQGWNWSVAGNSNPYSEALWPANYSGRNAPYPAENSDPAIAPNRDPANAYVWNRLAGAGVSFRNYGFYVNADATGQMVGTDATLNANTDHAFRGYDLNCPNNPDTFTPRSTTCGTPRFTAWKNEFDQYVKNGNLPTVEFVRLPNDHTAATRAGMPTPRAYVADNDLALGRLVDAVSHSPYWKDTAIFVTEDDAQNGPDHVDAHRTISQVISPYTQTGKVDSTFYSTTSMLRTIENIVGISPLTQFDAYATPMTGAFVGNRNEAPYAAVRPAQAGNATNGQNAPMAAVSAAQKLDKEDQINEQQFNEAIWKSVRGADSTMPAPVHTVLAAGAPVGAASSTGGQEQDG